MIDTEIDGFVTPILEASDADRHAFIIDLHRVAHDIGDMLLPIRVGIRLRDSGHYEISKSVLSVSVFTAKQRQFALYETATVLSRQNRPTEAFACLTDLKKEYGLSSYQVPLLVLQLTRLSQFEAAEDELELALTNDSSFAKEYDVGCDFIAFYQQFPQDRANRLHEKMASGYRIVGTQEIEADVLNALTVGRPYLLLRMGDGEGSHTRISGLDERRYAELYRANRLEFHQIWFANKTLLGSEEFNKVLDHYDEAVSCAECLGGYDLGLTTHEYRIGCRRGIPAMVNLLRRAEMLLRDNPDRAGRTGIAPLTIHYHLLSSGSLKRLLTNRKWVGLVSCHPDLPLALARCFGIDHVEYHYVPGEISQKNALGSQSVKGEHFPDRYHAVSSELANTQPGRLYLVAAGLLGKSYCLTLRQAGCVVLDIGAVADMWMGRKTRDFPADAVEHDLTQYVS